MVCNQDSSVPCGSWSACLVLETSSNPGPLHKSHREVIITVVWMHFLLYCCLHHEHGVTTVVFIHLAFNTACVMFVLLANIGTIEEIIVKCEI